MVGYVSSLIRVMNGVDECDSASAGKSTAPITRDLLGGCPLDTKELDLDLHVPCGWEKHLDLKSGKVYLHRCNSFMSSENSTQSKKSSKFQDLNFPPSSRKTLRHFDDNISLDLKLDSSNLSSRTSSSYQSVCTLDKVKSALERAEKDTMRKRSISMSKSSSSVSNSSSSAKDGEYHDHAERSSASFAAGCPSCLLYVLISKNNPTCPRCNSIVPLPFEVKKPRIDLNISF